MLIVFLFFLKICPPIPVIYLILLFIGYSFLEDILETAVPRCSTKQMLLKLAMFLGKHIYRRLLFNIVADSQPVILLKWRLHHGYFPMNFSKLLRTPFLQDTSKWLVLIFRKFDIRAFNLKEICSLYQYCRHVLFDTFLFCFWLSKKRELW